MSIEYLGSPHAEYLQDVGEPLDSLHSDPSYATPPSPVSTASDVASQPSSSEVMPSPAPALPRRQSSAASRRFAETLKYTLATSSLLNPHLADALPLYPPPTTPKAEAKDASSTKKVANSTPKMEWEPGWEHKGPDWWEQTLPSMLQGVLGSILIFVVAAIDLLSSSPPAAPSSTSSGQVEEPGGAKAEKEKVYDRVMASVTKFVEESQGLDLRIAKALTAIREVECISWGLGLSSPLPPISRLESAISRLESTVSSSRPRLSSPLGFNKPSPSHSRNSSLTSSTSQHPNQVQRAKPLRASLARTLADLTASTNDARFSLRALVGSDETAQASIKDEEEPYSALEESESEERTEWDSSFGGVSRRRTSIRSHVRPATPRRSRPTSLLIPNGTSPFSILPLRSSTPPPPTPEQRQSASSFAPRSDAPPALALNIAELQNAFEDLHAVRRGLVWKVLGFVDRDPTVSAAQWLETASILDGLTASLKKESGGVKKSVEEEFGTDELLVSIDRLDSSTSTLRRENPVVNGRVAGEPRPRPASWHRSAGLAALNLTSPTTTSTPTPQRTRPLSLSFSSNYSVLDAALQNSPTPKTRSSVLSSSLPASSTVPATPNFAPPPTGPSAPELDFSAQLSSLSLGLRTVAAKLHVVRTDLATSSSLGEKEAVLRVHEGIKADLEGLVRAWEGSQVALRTLCRPPRGASTSLEAEGQEEDESVGERSLDSIPDDEEDDEEEEGQLFEGTSTSRGGGVSPDSSAGGNTLRPPGGLGDSDDEDQTRRFVVPLGAREDVFEAVVPDERRRNGAGGGAGKMSREERIAAMKEERRKGGSPTGMGKGVKFEAGMVAELKDVLVLLKGRRKLSQE